METMVPGTHLRKCHIMFFPPRNLWNNLTEPPFWADETQKGKVIFPRSHRPVNGRDRTEL